MSEIKGCMNCGNISCGNNKKRRVDGCGRYISPEDKIRELEKENERLTVSYETLKLHDEEEIGMLKSENAELKAQNEEIENYFVESAGYGRDKVKNFMDIVNKALKQKGERITELEAQIEKMKCCYNCSKWNDGECEESPKSKTFFCADFKCESWECIK